VDVETLVGEVHRNARSMAEHRKVNFLTDTPSAQVYVTADRPRLLQVLNNLVSNALKFTPASGTVNLRAELVGAKCRFSVQDTGVGMSTEQQAAIAQYFRSPKDGDAQAWEGWLGLWICSHLVRLHGGEIVVKSQAGLGTTISFELDVSH
jgi:signal transduction histidine kinase